LFAGVIFNVGLKVLLMNRYAQVGLAFATSVGAWINLALLVWFSARRGFLVIDASLRRSGIKLVGAGVVLAAGLLISVWPVRAMLAGHSFHNELMLVVLGLVGGVVYGAAMAALFRRELRELFRGRSGTPKSPDSAVSLMN
jgi:putative peptidoglycan lipid II flippase